MKKVEVVLTGKAVCIFVRRMKVYEDEVEELLNNEDLIANNLDDSNAAFAISEWQEVTAVKQD